MPVSADDHPVATDSTTSAASQTNTSPLTGPSSLGSAFDAQGLPTVHEVAHYKTHHDFNSMDHRLRSPMRRPSGGSGTGSRNGSAGSSVGRSFDDKLLEAPPLPYGNSSQVSATPVSPPSFEETPRRSTMPNGNGNGHPREAPSKQSGEVHHRRLSKANAARREKRGGIRNTLRRMLGIQRSPKDRISMPNPAVYPRHNPEEFITSATDVDAKPQRSASVPANAVPRRSALSSHPPSTRHTVVRDAAAAPEAQQPTTPPRPERRAPERPRRPRSASVPSVLIQDMQAMEAAMATNVNVLDKEGLNLQDVEAQNIGFAVTNGSNPKRRSRSVGAFPSGDHRMSPIQWHHIRRRSDEIRYWRESTQLSSFGGLKGMGSPENLEPVLAKGDIEDPTGETADENADENGLGEHNEQFNFGLPAETLQMQNPESMGLEERLITMEIKLMDFEYALSKLQAGSTSSLRHSQVETAKRQQSMESYRHSDAPQASVEASPAISQGPFSRSISHKPSLEDLMNPKPRPTSVATTIKQGAHSGIHTSSEKPPSTDRGGGGGMRSSLTNLTIEHYTTLITLIRHEQLARQRLEEQVTSLQEQLDRQALSSFSQQQQRDFDYYHSPPHHNHHQHHPSSSQHSHTFSSSQSSSRRHGMIDPEQQPQPSSAQQHSQSRRRGLGVGGGSPYSTHQQHSQQQQQQQPPLLRPRSSSYSTNATTNTTDDDTDDDYHDVYVTAEPTPVMDQPAERGEYERGAFDRITVGEGVAF